MKNNKWIETVDSLQSLNQAMRENIIEKQRLIDAVMAENKRLWDQNDKLAALIELLTTRKGEKS